MRSRTSFFNRTVFWKTLGRFWPLAALYAAIWCAVLPLALMNASRYTTALEAESFVMDCAGYPAACITFAAGAVAAMAVFGWMYAPRSTVFTAALPVRREAQFLSSFLAGLAMLLAGNVLAFLLALGAESVNGTLNAAALGQWLAVVSLEGLAFYGFAAFCAMLTGSLFVLPLVYSILEITAAVVERLTHYILDCVIYGMSWDRATFAVLSPLWTLLSGSAVLPVTTYDAAQKTDILTGYVYTGWTEVGLYALSGAVFALLALLLFRRRRMETAGDVVAIPILKPLFRWCLALAGTLGVGGGVYYLTHTGTYVAGTWPHTLLLLALMLAGGFVGWFGADMLMLKSFRVFRLHMRGWMTFSAAVCALLLCCELDVFGTEKRVPAETEVASVRFGTSGMYTEISQPDNVREILALQRSIIGNKAMHESEAPLAWQFVSLTYYDADGNAILMRQYYLAATPDQRENRGSDLRALETALNSTEAIVYRKQVAIPVTANGVDYAAVTHFWEPAYETRYVTAGDAGTAAADDAVEAPQPFSLSLTDEEAYDLYTNCILPDIADGTIGRIWLVADESFARSIYNYTISLSFSYRYADGHSDYAYFYTTPTVNSLRTDRWLQEHGVELETYWAALEAAGRTSLVEGNNLGAAGDLVYPYNG